MPDPNYAVHLQDGQPFSISLNVNPFPGGAPPIFSLTVNGVLQPGGPNYNLLGNVAASGTVLVIGYWLDGFSTGVPSEGIAIFTQPTGAVAVPFPVGSANPIHDPFSSQGLHQTVVVVTS